MSREPLPRLLEHRWVVYLVLALVLTVLMWPEPSTGRELDEGDGEGLDGILQVTAVLVGVGLAGIVALVGETLIRQYRRQ